MPSDSIVPVPHWPWRLAFNVLLPWDVTTAVGTAEPTEVMHKVLGLTQNELHHIRLCLRGGLGWWFGSLEIRGFSK